MKRTVLAGLAGFIAGAATLGALGMSGLGARTPSLDGREPTLSPSAGNEWCVAHLHHGELGLGTQSAGWNGRVRDRNDLAVTAEGRLVSFAGGWLRLDCQRDGEVWIPEDAIRAVEFLPKEAFAWRNGPPPGWMPDGR